MHTPDGEQVYQAGQAFYWAPGHAPEALEDSEYVDLTPTDEFNLVVDHIKPQGYPRGHRPQGTIHTRDGRMPGRMNRCRWSISRRERAMFVLSSDSVHGVTAKSKPSSLLRLEVTDVQEGRLKEVRIVSEAASGAPMSP
jgi:hypothetical protein